MSNFLIKKYKLLSIICAFLVLVPAFNSAFFQPARETDILARNKGKASIVLENVVLEEWIGSDSPLVTFSFINKSEGEALNFKCELEDTNGNILQTSNLGYMLNKSNLSIKKDCPIPVPIVSSGELQKHFNNSGIKGEILGVGLSPNIDFKCLRVNGIVKAIPLILKYHYNTIFADHVVGVHEFYAYLKMS